ncbi:MAG: nuclear transport factor 2 family protein [Phycisphaerae bacterium]|nr:nuclear transport factor 2 family protein [Phycisphaerae bacterium]
MRTPACRFGVGAAIALVLVAAIVHGCERPGTRPSDVSTADVDRGVKDLLDRWKHAFESRDIEGVRSVLATDDRFVWLEDGEPRYRSVDEIVRALAGFPPVLAFTHGLRDIRVVPISNDAAWAHLATSTKIQHSGRVVSEFTSVVLMIVRREETGWRIHAAHTSTSKPRGPGPG